MTRTLSTTEICFNEGVRDAQRLYNGQKLHVQRTKINDELQNAYSRGYMAAWEEAQRAQIDVLYNELAKELKT